MHHRINIAALNSLQSEVLQVQQQQQNSTPAASQNNSKRQSYSKIEDSEGSEQGQDKRRKTLNDIQTNKLSKIKLETQGYARMDETTLKLYGLRNCQLALVRKLRTRSFMTLQIGAICLFMLVQLAQLLVHDILYSQLLEASEAYKLRDVEIEASEH